MKQKKEMLRANKKELIPFTIGLPEILISEIIAPNVRIHANKINTENLILKILPLISKMIEEKMKMKKTISSSKSII